MRGTIAKRPRRTRRRRIHAEGPPKILALLASCPLYPEPTPGRCGACAKALVGRRTRWCSRACSRSWRENHLWTYARRAARRRDRHTCRHCRTKVEKVEVNHITALAGVKRAEAGCLHHLDNLESLCVDCHHKVTAAQAADRAAARRAAKAAKLADLLEAA